MNKQTVLNQPIHWNDVNKRLIEEKAKTMSWLNNALLTPKINKNNVYDILNRRISDLEHHYEMENASLKAQLRKVTDLLGIGYANSFDMFEYVHMINRVKKLLIVITAKDTPGMSISEPLLKQLKELGIKTKLTKEKHWCGYIAVISRGTVIFENCEHEKSWNTSLIIRK